MKLYGLAAVFLLLAILFFDRTIPGSLEATSLWIPFAGAFCVHAALACVGFEVFGLTLWRDRPPGMPVFGSGPPHTEEEAEGIVPKVSRPRAA